MKMPKWLHRLLESLYVDKYNCIVCNAELSSTNKYSICPTCMAKMPFNDGKNICKLCGKHMKDEADYCLTCQRETFLFDRNRSKFIYKGLAKKLILGYKFGGKKYDAKYLAEWYIDLYHEAGYESDVVVCVPLSRERLRERGYNQTEIIARIVAERLGLPFVDGAVVKIKDLIQQEKLSGKDRIVGVLGAFKVNDIDAVKDKNVLVIDDILTTGATMNAMAMELKRYAKRVEGLTFASPEVNYSTAHGDIIQDYGEELEKD